MDNAPENDYLSMKFRELRHNPCLMTPLSAIILSLFSACAIFGFLMKAPAFVIGILLGPLFSRKSWFIEFLYPLGLGRWGHLMLVRLTAGKKKQKGHSKTLQQRIEVVPDKVYIHPISQLLDNISYLVVSCDGPGCLVAFVVDCGDAQALLEYTDAIREKHYGNRQLDIQAILCTHKHHDHTAGNKKLLEVFPKAKVYGTIVERVPYCTDNIINGDFLDLPKDCAMGNNMNDLVQVEVICCPGHTRGSVTYALRSVNIVEGCHCYLFTGDTMFSCGGGVPFEADFEVNGTKKGGGYIRASSGMYTTERCFAEIAYRSNSLENASNVLLFPGHEYTTDLTSRQFIQSVTEPSHWSKFAPATFLRMAGQLYISNHKRGLPQGKLLTVPSALSLELDTNPHFRTLRKRGEDIIRALQLWYRLIAKTFIPNEESKIEIDPDSPKMRSKRQNKKNSNKPNSNFIWNMKADDISKPIFTSVYTSDLDEIIYQVEKGKLGMKDLAKSLKEMKNRTEIQVVGRRPIPGTFPDDKIIYNACVALAMIGSPPCAMTFKDSALLKLPKPVAPANTHKINISLKRVLSMLTFLGLIQDNTDGWDLIARIRLLWKEAREYGVSEKYVTSVDTEIGDEDVIELGVLRWMLFGIEANQPTWFERYCMPCGKGPPKTPTLDHPLNGSDLRRTNGELVKHDPLTCPLCLNMTGCPHMIVESETCIEIVEDVNIEAEHDDDQDEANSTLSPAHSNSQLGTIQLQFTPDYGNSLPPKTYRMHHFDDKVEIQDLQTSHTF